jgi:hypothetical protein
MWLACSIAYVAVGLATAGITLAFFPPEVGHRPSWWMRMLAVGTYIALWPMLALLGVGYQIGTFFSGDRMPPIQADRIGHPRQRVVYRRRPIESRNAT